MYVDGSLANGKSGIGVFISTPARSEYYALPLDDQTCNVRAEALALRLAAILIDQHADLRQAIVISDCRPALTQADKHIGIGARTGSLLRKNKAKALWCPSHVGIPGNEIADQLAYQASTDKADDSAKLLQDRGIPISSLPANAYRDTRWWKKKCSAALTLKWNKTWNDMKTSLHKWKPTIGPWKSKLTSRLKADLLLAKLRLNRHPLQGTPGQQRPACRCGAHTLSYTHTINQCPLWTQQRNALLDDTRRALENPDISMQTLPDTLLQSHKKAFHEWKLADLLCEFLSNTAGA
jgi:kelch-like protein 2/3